MGQPTADINSMQIRPKTLNLRRLLVFTACALAFLAISLQYPELNRFLSSGAEIAMAENLPCDNFYSCDAKDIDGKPTSMSEFKGQVLLIVNTASRCGFTSQYGGLQKLHETYGSRGFKVLGFPSNDFMNQEPGENQEIKKFCSVTFGVNFPLFARDHVKGPQKQSVYKYLTEAANPELSGEVKWNFEKFMVDRNGQLRYRFSSITGPSSKKIIKAIEGLLDEEAKS